MHVYTNTSSVCELIGDDQSAKSVEDARLFGTNGRWWARRGWELMVELSGCGSANGKWEVIREKKTCAQLSIRWTERGSGLPTASFIIICLAGGSESGQTEQTPSIFLLLLVALLFLLILLSSVIFILCYLSYVWHLHCFLILWILSTFFVQSILFHPFLCCFFLSHRCHLSHIHLFHPFLAVYKLSLTFGFHSIVLALFITFTFIYCAILFLSFLFIQYALTPLVCRSLLSISALQFSSSVFHLSFHHLPVTLDVFHFSSFYSNLSLHWFTDVIFL